ncbi:hypothetical protein DIZ76_012295 [Coccidioides immitis]|nr:hypothetical protein DIZ76_012295 [Coccidioides immitis]
MYSGTLQASASYFHQVSSHGDGKPSWIWALDARDFKLRKAWLTLIQDIQPSIPEYHGDEPNPVAKFRDAIEQNPTLYSLAISMFDEVPTKAPYDRDATTLKKQVRSYKTMLYLFQTLLTRVPEWFSGKDSSGKDVPTGLIGFPFNIILD